MNDRKNLEGFLNALDDQIEGATLLVSDAKAFFAATQAIEKLLAEEWPVLKADVRVDSLSTSDKERLSKLLASINALETKTRARLAWSEDFEAHMQRAMETAS